MSTGEYRGADGHLYRWHVDLYTGGYYSRERYSPLTGIWHTAGNYLPPADWPAARDALDLLDAQRIADQQDQRAVEGAVRAVEAQRDADPIVEPSIWNVLTEWQRSIGVGT
jgi:hypothetical protein